MEVSSKEEIILKILKQSNFATIQQISQLSGLSRITVAKYLGILEARGLVWYQPIGRAKLYAIRENQEKQESGAKE